MLIFARHGNTFEPNEVPRIVGANEDLPLTLEGKEQALILGRALSDAGVLLDGVRAGPLMRTLEFAQLTAVAAGFGGKISVDQRLRELDFGAWAGLSDAEIIDVYGEGLLNAWRKAGRRPGGCDWAPSEQVVRSNLQALVAEANGTTLYVTSNGILRYAMELDSVVYASAGQDGGFRVKTGNACGFELTKAGPKIIFWDKKPHASLFRRSQP